MIRIIIIESKTRLARIDSISKILNDGLSTSTLYEILGDDTRIAVDKDANSGVSASLLNGII